MSRNTKLNSLVVHAACACSPQVVHHNEHLQTVPTFNAFSRTSRRSLRWRGQRSVGLSPSLWPCPRPCPGDPPRSEPRWLYSGTLPSAGDVAGSTAKRQTKQKVGRQGCVGQCRLLGCQKVTTKYNKAALNSVGGSAAKKSNNGNNRNHNSCGITKSDEPPSLFSTPLARSLNALVRCC